MADGGEDGMDLESLQAQIDMSMAFTHDLVSGWMKASKVKLPSSSRANDDRELEEYMRRPPRLGVGASAPESTGVLSRETVKLRNKLVGSNKKRAREDDDALGAGSANSASRPIVVSDDDDEDSRARVITKKARVDPFAPKAKEKKKGNTDPLQALASAPPIASPSKKAALVTSIKATHPQQDSASVEGPPEDGAGPSTPKKRKKRKKHKSQGDESVLQEDPQLIASQPRETPATSVFEKQGSGDVAAMNTRAPEKDLCRKLSMPIGTEALSPNPSGDSSSQPQAPATPARRPSAVPQSSPQRLDPFGMPLLNLTGPPPTAVDDQSTSPKKKRKKKKKKKKRKAEAEADTAAANLDGADGEGEDDDEEEE